MDSTWRAFLMIVLIGSFLSGAWAVEATAEEEPIRVFSDYVEKFNHVAATAKLLGDVTPEQLLDDAEAAAAAEAELLS